MEQTLTTPVLNEQGTSYGQAVGKFIVAWLLSVVAGSIVGAGGFLVMGDGLEDGAIILLLILGSAITSIPYALMGIIGLSIARGQVNLPVSWRRKRFFLVINLIAVAIIGLICLAGGEYVFLAILPVWGIPGGILQMLMVKEKHFEGKEVKA